jgi:hypothetical protein
LKVGPQVANPAYRSERGLRDIFNSAAFLTLAIILMVLVLAWALFRASQRIKTLPQQEL